MWSDIPACRCSLIRVLVAYATDPCDKTYALAIAARPEPLHTTLYSCALAPKPRSMQPTTEPESEPEPEMDYGERFLCLCSENRVKMAKRMCVGLVHRMHAVQENGASVKRNSCALSRSLYLHSLSRSALSLSLSWPAVGTSCVQLGA